jgi:EAL domain-containing protein (putative c-di-GMP-specific phosphodiesterase class I)
LNNRTPSGGNTRPALEAPFSELLASRNELSVGTASVDKFLTAVRRHLGMDVAFVSEFRDIDRIFHHVDARAETPVHAGDAIPMEEGYCRHVVEGRLPELIPDTRLVPAALALPATNAIPIGAHLSVPIRLADGSCYGTFCCFSFAPDRSLSQRDLEMMRVFADMLAAQIDFDIDRSKSRTDRIKRIESVLSGGHPSIVYQPISDLSSNRITGFECLSRFHVEPSRPPDQWFAEAGEVGLGADLEIVAIREALRALDVIPSPLYLTINCSPTTITSGALLGVLSPVDVSRVVVEITEHDYVHDYAQLMVQLALLRALGMRVAIDDVGAGYSSMRHILQIQPDFIKLDISLTQGIDSDSTRRALAAALIAFAKETGATIVAEGVETEAELNTLKRLGIARAQGYFLGRPVALAEALAKIARPVSIVTPLHPIEVEIPQQASSGPTRS